MNSLSDREAAFESRFAREEDARFRLRVARDRIVARWAADRMGLRSADASALEEDFIAANVARSDSEAAEDLGRRLEAKGAAIEIERIRRKLDAAFAEAVAADAQAFRG